MDDGRDERLDMLFAAARSVKPDTSAAEEYFETRLMASLRQRREQGRGWLFWLWRLAPSLTVAVVLLGVSTLVLQKDRSMDIFAAMINDQAEYQVAGYLGGN